MKNIKKEVERTQKELTFVENENLVKTYKALQTKLKKLKELEEETYKKDLIHKYETCHHITVFTKKVLDPLTGHARIYRKCIKCGLDSEVLYKKDYQMTKEDEIAYDYLSENFFNQNDIYFPNNTYEEVKELYNKLKEENPNKKEQQLVLELSKALKVKTLKKEKN